MTPAEEDIRRLIALEGPLPLARVMALANAHYYATRDPFGREGDFITAPEISQMFGELLGLWAAAWDMMGRPDPVLLVELGPGRGTLMADGLRAARALPPFRDAVRVHLVETSPVLRAAQQRTLESAGSAVTWHARVQDLPDGPAIILANEFFDALPVHQFVRMADGWAERAVGLDKDDRLVFGLLPTLSAEAAAHLPAGQIGDVVELAPDALRVLQTLCARIKTQGGAFLTLDYGYAGGERGDTVQALRRHRFAPVLEELGAADLTAHVDFASLAAAARAAGCSPHGATSQRDFLLRLGLRERASVLKRAANVAQSAAIDEAVARLTDPKTTGMGALFKAFAVSPAGWPVLPGFA